jgi:hypothetical protein
MKLLFTRTAKEKPPFTTRKLKKNDARFIRDYHKTEYYWYIMRNTPGTEPENEKVTFKMPCEELNEWITNNSILQIINTEPVFAGIDLEEGDNLRVAERYIYNDISNVSRKPEAGYLSFLFNNKNWIADVCFFYGDYVIVDEGYIETIE